MAAAYSSDSFDSSEDILVDVMEIDDLVKLNKSEEPEVQPAENSGAEPQPGTSKEECADLENPVLSEVAAGTVKERLADLQNPSASGTSASGPSASGLANGVEKILDRHRNEIMFELRRLRLGDRPVTGQGHKEAVEEFFTSSQSNEPAPTAEHRPEAVVVEVQGLVERRPVSSVLGSARFRQRLENAVRSSLTGTRFRGQQVSVQDRIQQYRNRVHQQRRPDTEERTDAARESSEETRMGPERMESPHRMDDTESTISTSGESFAGVGGARAAVEPVVERIPTLPVSDDPSVAPLVDPNPIPGPQRTQSWLQQQPQPGNSQDGYQMFAWDQLEHEHRETIVSEISELVHQQLVTSQLHGNFRDVLEGHMRDRVGQDGHRVRNFIRSLAPAPVPHNDFSHLGISVNEHPALSDEISVISAAAAVHIPQAQTQSNAAMTAEMKALKAQVKELKNMMKMSFDLQMDIQRSIRQEVAAAMCNATGGSAASVEPRAAHSRPVPAGKCIICLDKDTDTVLYQCGHMCLCYTCGQQLKQREAHCPMCRAPVKDIIRTYRTDQ